MKNVLHMTEEKPEPIAPLLTIPDVCALLQISPSTLERYVKKGWIRKISFGRTTRFKREELGKLLN